LSRAPAGAPVALYVHVPFCLSICPYCDFVVYAGKQAHGSSNRLEAFVAALLVEIRLRAEAAARSSAHLPPLASVYIGGGTPSLLSARQVAAVVAEIDAGFGLQADCEITLEANPGPRERGDLRGFRSAGVNRLSIGAQGMDAAALRRLGRRHAPDDVIETVRQARAAGFDNLSVDLLYDQPGQTLATWGRSLEAVLACEPEHVSAYALALDDQQATVVTPDHLPATTGALRWRERARSEQDEDRAAACYEIAEEALSGGGLHWYELSNWARPGRQSRHNLAYWQWLSYEAVGPGAHAFDGALTRRWNAARLDGYLGALLAPEPAPPPGGRELLDPPTAAAERAILALRTRAGLPVQQALLPAFAAALGWGRSAGLLEPGEDGGLRLSARGRLLGSELFWRLLPGRLALVG
jgi:oxygen-independent coproporphyrinogen III oxidase